MTDQQLGPVIPLESAALEFSNAFSLTIARLVTEKLEMAQQNIQLRILIAKLEKDVLDLEREGQLINSRPKAQSEPDKVTWDK